MDVALKHCDDSNLLLSGPAIKGLASEKRVQAQYLNWFCGQKTFNSERK